MLSPHEKYPLAPTTKGVIFLKNFIHNPNIQVGDYTYYDGRDKPESFELTNVVFALTSKLFIGRFCQLAYGTKFVLSDANHPMEGFSTYPFYVYGTVGKGSADWGGYEPNLTDKGDTIVGNDVWCGHESLLMPGVTVGNGAIIGSRAVVTKDVPPYAIVGGNPAKVLKFRFPENVIKELQEIEWWNWEYEKISRNIPIIASADLKKLKEAR